MVALGAVVNDTTPAEPSDYGLLSSAVTVINDTTPYWVNGFEYEDLNCLTEVKLTSICNTNVAVTAVEGTGNELWRKYFPFSVNTYFKCSTMGRSPEEIKQIATDHLAACVQKGIEFEAWTGELAKAAAADSSWDELANGAYPNRYLASDDVVDLTPTAGAGVRVKHALALLEGALARCGCGTKGTIHMPHEIVSALAPKEKNGVLVTPLGNKIVAGSGYTGSGPSGVTVSDSEFWVYATGPVTVRLGDVYVTPDKTSQAVDIAKNETVFYAEQPAAVTWGSCCHFGVLVDLSLDFA